jgi:hypothetical protein
MFAVSKVKGGEKVRKYLHWTYIQCETQFDLQIKICNLSNYMHFMQQTVYRKNDAIHYLRHGNHRSEVENESSELGEHFKINA